MSTHRARRGRHRTPQQRHEGTPYATTGRHRASETDLAATRAIRRSATVVGTVSAVALIGVAQAPAVEQAHILGASAAHASTAAEFVVLRGITALSTQLAQPQHPVDDRRAALDRATRSAQRDPRGAGRVLAAETYGWTGEQWSCLDQLWTHESDWNYRAVNPTSGAYGIPQSLPASKMATVAPDWRTNPVTQMRWGLSYIRRSYQSPCSAWGFWQRHHWY